MRLSYGMFGLVLLLSACQALPLAILPDADDAERTLSAGSSANKAKGRSLGPAQSVGTVKLKPGAAASAEASIEPAPSPSPTAQPTPKPTVPPWGNGPTKLLTGKSLIDATYALKVGGSLISNNGGGLISNNSGGVIAIGSGLISNNGGGLLSDKGSGLISSNSGGLISNHGAGYRLLEAPAVEQGLLLPVKGLMIAPFSLTTGKQLGPAVLTDGQGDYRLKIPEAQQANVILLSMVPGQDPTDALSADPRLRFRLIVPAEPQQAQSALDEDSALVTQYMRSTFISNFNQIFSAADDAAVDAIIKEYALSPEGSAVVTPMFRSLSASTRAVNYTAWPQERRNALCQGMLDILLANLELDTVRMENSGVKNQGTLSGPTWPALQRCLKAVRERVNTMLAASPTAFESNPSLLQANAGRPADQAYKVLKGADFGDFVVREYLNEARPDTAARLMAAMMTINMPKEPESGANIVVFINVCGMSVNMEMCKALLVNKGGCKTQCDALLARLAALP